MKKRIIAKRYASALLNVTKKNREMERVLEEMNFLKKLLSGNPALKRFLESPAITQEEKNALVRKVLSPVLIKTSVNFLLLLVKKYRLLYLTNIIEEYHRLYDAEKVLQRADVITVLPLDEALVERLRNAIERTLKKSIEMTYYIDPRILGGVIIKTPNLIIDGSVRKQLRDLSYSLTTFKV